MQEDVGKQPRTVWEREWGLTRKERQMNASEVYTTPGGEPTAAKGAR